MAVVAQFDCRALDLGSRDVPPLPDDRIEISPHLAAVLDIPHARGRSEYGPLVRWLAHALGFDERDLGPEAVEIVARLAVPLGAVLDKDATHWVTISEDKTHERIAREAVADLDAVALIAALNDLGWSNLGQKPMRIDDTNKIEDRLRGLLTHRLASRIFGAIDKWHRGGAWEGDKRRAVNEAARRDGYMLHPPKSVE